MKIEKGKFYRTRGGNKVEILKTDVKNTWPIIGLITNSEDYEICASWSDNGKYDAKYLEKHSCDIIGEWEEVLDFDPYCLPKWADQWIAMDADGEWHCYSIEPTLDEDYQIWCTNIEGDESEIPVRFRPKNYSGDWKDSLFNVEQLKKVAHKQKINCEKQKQ